MLLETTWTTATGTATVTDALATGGADDPHAIGADRAPAARPRAGVHRWRGRDGRGVRAAARVRAGGAAGHGGGGRRDRPGRRRRRWCCRARSPCSTSPVRPHPDGCGSPPATACCSGCSTARRPNRGPVRCRPRELDDALRATADAWRAWSRLHQNYEGPWRDLVHHSGRVLQALTYQPDRCDGAPPRRPRCPRRSAASATGTTATPGSGTPASPSRPCGSPPARTRPTSSSTTWRPAPQARSSAVGDLQIMFGVGGEHDLSERELPHLAGWRGSRPVRVGNGAWNQRQIDVYGELLGAAAPARRPSSTRTTRVPTAWRQFLVACADAAARRWREKDQGIWEVRGGPPLPLLEAHVLGRARPGHRARRHAARRRTGSPPGAAAATRSAPRS